MAQEGEEFFEVLQQRQSEISDVFVAAVEIGVGQCEPRGTLQNRPMRDTSKPANETESGQALLYLAGGPSGN
jgi:hypothetical protein